MADVTKIEEAFVMANLSRDELDELERHFFGFTTNGGRLSKPQNKPEPLPELKLYRKGYKQVYSRESNKADRRHS